jgi:hypothetical protein
MKWVMFELAAPPHLLDLLQLCLLAGWRHWAWRLAAGMFFQSYAISID